MKQTTVNANGLGRVVEGTMNYLGPMDETPYVDVLNRGRDRLNAETHTIRFTDARPAAGELSLDREGFRLVHHRTALAPSDFRAQQRVEQVYAREIESIVKAVTGADRVVAAPGAVLRFNGERDKTVKPAAIAHSDYTEYTLRAELGFHVNLRSAEFTGFSRIVAYQTWRALSPPPQDNTLALCDSRTVSVKNRVVSKFDAGGDVPLEFYMYRDNPARR